MTADECRYGTSQLSAIVLTFNDEMNLPECLMSLEGLDCKIFVVDSGSTDRTVEIAKAAGAHVVEHPFENYGAQRNWAQASLPLDTEWLLHLDADERIMPDLAKEICQVLQDPPAEIDGFMISRRILFMGRHIAHGGLYPTYHMRLFRKGRGSCEDRLYDQHFLVKGNTVKLKNDFVDVITSDLTAWTQRHTRWADFEYQEETAGHYEGAFVSASYFGNSIEKRRWLREKLYLRFPLFARVFLYFLYRYFIRLGFLDGKEGLVFHFLQGCWYRFFVDAKIFEARVRARANKSRSLTNEPESLQNLDRVELREQNPEKVSPPSL